MIDCSHQAHLKIFQVHWTSESLSYQAETLPLLMQTLILTALIDCKIGEQMVRMGVAYCKRLESLEKIEMDVSSCLDEDLDKLPVEVVVDLAEEVDQILIDLIESLMLLTFWGQHSQLIDLM